MEPATKRRKRNEPRQVEIYLCKSEEECPGANPQTRDLRDEIWQKDLLTSGQIGRGLVEEIIGGLNKFYNGRCVIWDHFLVLEDGAFSVRRGVGTPSVSVVPFNPRQMTTFLNQYTQVPFVAVFLLWRVPGSNITHKKNVFVVNNEQQVIEHFGDSLTDGIAEQIHNKVFAAATPVTNLWKPKGVESKLVRNMLFSNVNFTTSLWFLHVRQSACPKRLTSEVLESVVPLMLDEGLSCTVLRESNSDWTRLREQEPFQRFTKQLISLVEVRLETNAYFIHKTEKRSDWRMFSTRRETKKFWDEKGGGQGWSWDQLRYRAILSSSGRLLDHQQHEVQFRNLWIEKPPKVPEEKSDDGGRPATVSEEKSDDGGRPATVPEEKSDDGGRPVTVSGEFKQTMVYKHAIYASLAFSEAAMKEIQKLHINKLCVWGALLYFFRREGEFGVLLNRGRTPEHRKPVDVSQMAEFIKQCKRKSKESLVCFYLGFSTGRSGHANVLVVNHHRKAVEHFEPWGTREDEKLLQKTEELMQRVLPEYEYFQPVKTCFSFKFISDVPTQRGPQSMLNHLLPRSVVGGTCAPWSIWYMNLRLKFPKLHPADVLRQATELIFDVSSDTWDRGLTPGCLDSFRNLDLTFLTTLCLQPPASEQLTALEKCVLQTCPAVDLCGWAEGALRLEDFIGKFAEQLTDLVGLKVVDRFEVTCGDAKHDFSSVESAHSFWEGDESCTLMQRFQKVYTATDKEITEISAGDPTTVRW